MPSMASFMLASRHLRSVGFLAVNGDVVAAAAMGDDELFGLDEHAARSAAGVVDAAVERLEHLDEQADDAAG